MECSGGDQILEMRFGQANIARTAQASRADRLGPWEVWLVGLVAAGRTRPIGWAVIPYPWPKGRFRTTT